MRVRKLKAKPKWYRSGIVRVMAITLTVLFLSLALLSLLPTPAKAADDYTFGSENVTKGISYDPSNKDVEDGNYNQLEEADQYTDTNFSGSSENVVFGTAGGDSFPTSMDTDDGSYRTYTEEDLGEAAPDPYSVYLWPTGDSTAEWDTVYPSGSHYEQVDETTEGGDGSTTYVSTGTTSDVDYFTMTDLGDPGSGYALDVTVFVVHQKDSNPAASVQAGIRIASTNYLPVYENPANGVWTNTSGTTWTVNPATTSEWTYAEVDALLGVITTDDASPTVFVTQLGLKVDVTFSGGSTNYTLDSQITYGSVANSSQTTGYKVFCQAYRSGSEDFGIYAWDYLTTSWNLKDTIDAGSDTDYDFALTWDEYDDVGEEVILRIKGLSDATDADQDVVYVDVLKVSRIAEGYSLDVDMTASSVAEYGNITVRIKGYTSPSDPLEGFHLNVWNYTSSAYDVEKLNITSTSNTWQTTIDLCDDYHRDGTSVKIQFTDATPSTSDTTRSSLYIDVAWVTRYHTDPTITLFGTLPTLINEGETAYFWCNYTDYDNEAPTVMDVNVDSVDYGMSKNDSGDVSYHNGVNYSYSTSALPNGNWTYYFRAQDANSGVVTSSSDTIAVNALPTLTTDGVDPTSGGPGTYSFYVTFTDEDDNSPAWVRVTIDGAYYDMVGNATNDGDYTDGESYYYEKVMAAGQHPYTFWTQDYNSGNITTIEDTLSVGEAPVISDFGVVPSAVTVGTEVTFFATYTDGDNDAPLFFDMDIEGNNWNMIENDTGDTTYTDGKGYYLTNTNLTAGNYTCYFKTQDQYSAQVDSSTFVVTINTLPTLTSPDVDPDTGNSGETFQFQIVFTDADGNYPTLIQVNVDTSDYDMVELTPADTNTVDGKDYYYDKPLSGGDHDYYFKTYDYLEVLVQTSTYQYNVNNPPTLGTFTRLPADPVYVDTTLNFTCIFTDIDGDLPTDIRWREGGGAIQNLSMAEVEDWDSDTTDGKEYYIELTLGHGVHNYDFYADDGIGWTSGGSNSVTIVNRDPIISDQPTDPSSTYRNTYWEYDCAGSDPDGDDTGWEMSTNASFLSINPTTGLVYGTTSDPVAWYATTVWLNDSYSGSDSYYFVLNVINRAPTISSSGNTTQAYNTYLSYAIAANDDDSDILTYELSTNASWASIASNVVSGTANEFGWFNFDVWVNDSYGGSAHQDWILTVGNTNPYFTSTPEYWGVNDTFYTYQAQATDPEGLPITYGLTSDAGFLSIHSTLGYVNGTPNLVGTYWVNVSAFDGLNYVYQNYSLGVNNTPPVITTSPDLTGTVGVAYYYDADATDGNSDTLQWNLVVKPAWAGIDYATGEVTGTPGANGIYAFELVVWDGYHYDWQNWSVTVTGGAVPPAPEPEPDHDAYAPFQARFTYFVTGMKVVVEDMSIGNVLKLQWSFGDGFGSQDSSVIHEYAKPGTYVITLTIWGPDGQKTSTQVEITVSSDPGWSIEKNQVGWVIVTPAGAFQWPVAVSMMIGLAIVVLSFGGQRFSWIRPKTFKIIGIGLIAIGVVFYGL